MAQPIVKYSETPSPMLSVVLLDPFLDITVHESTRQAIERHWREGLAFLELDLDCVEFMDSSGVGLIVSLHKRMGGGARRVRLKNIKPPLKNIFKLLCLDDLFEFV